MRNALVGRRRASPNDADDGVAFSEQELGEERAVLTWNAGDEGGGHTRAFSLAKRGAPKSSPTVGRSVFSSSRRRTARRTLDLAGGQAPRADLDLHDLPALVDDADDLQVWPPDAARLVVRVRDVVSERDTAPA